MNKFAKPATLPGNKTKINYAQVLLIEGMNTKTSEKVGLGEHGLHLKQGTMQSALHHENRNRIHLWKWGTQAALVKQIEPSYT